MFMKTLFRLFVAVAVVTACTSLASADTFGSGANQFTLDFVDIGNPNNTADTTGSPNLAGAVPYVYRIGKYEVSEDMINKANTVGGLGITKDTRGTDKPATGISWNEAARFINWLNTSEGLMPAYKFAVQPGGVCYNANANIQLWQSGDPGYNSENLFRNDLAAYFLPIVAETQTAKPRHSHTPTRPGADKSPCLPPTTDRLHLVQKEIHFMDM